MTDKNGCWTARGIIALNWLAVVLVFAVPGVARAHALTVFGVFRVCAILGLVYLVYASRLPQHIVLSVPWPSCTSRGEIVWGVML
jgi:hypothetical protein